MFRRRKVEKMLSAEELKSKLYSHLDKKGSLNRMRVELREKLMSELLKKAAPVEDFDMNSHVYSFDRALLPLQISNWLVYDHLLRQGFQYTLSIFVTEANFPTNPEKLLGACDILVLLGLDSNSSEYKSICQMCSSKKAQDLTHSLLVAVIKCLFDLTTREGKYNEISDIKEQKDAYDTNKEALVQERTFDSESAEFKMSDSVLKKRKGSLELSLHDHVQVIKEEKEKEIQALRLKLLQELDRLHSQDRKQRLEMEQLQSDLHKEKEDIFNKEEKLRQKELLLDKEFENKLERKTRELETDFISKIHMKEKDLEIFQRKLNEKELRLNEMELNLANQRENSAALKREMEDMKQTYTSLQKKYSNLLDENTNLLKKFESMSDYAVLKGDLETKSKEVAGLLQKLEECHKHAEKEKEALLDNTTKLGIKLRTKESELLEAQRQLNLARDTLRMEEAVWHKERKKLEQETHSSKELYQTLLYRIEEQKEDIQALHRTIHILHYQLTDKNTRNTARIEPFIPQRPSFKISDMPKRESEVFRINNSPPKYRENSLKFIEEAKDRINKLQQEADSLQNKYSVIYSSAPSLTSQFSKNPLFNSTIEQRFHPISHVSKPFSAELQSTHFENLIRNELPTLDLNFPTHVNNQFVPAFSDVYKPVASTRSPIKTTAINISHNSNNNSVKRSDHINNQKPSTYSFTLHSNVQPLSQGADISMNELKAENKEANAYDLSNINNAQIWFSDSNSKTKNKKDERPFQNIHDDLQDFNNSNTSNKSSKETGPINQQPVLKYTDNTQNMAEVLSSVLLATAEKITPAATTNVVQTETPVNIKKVDEVSSEVQVLESNENKTDSISVTKNKSTPSFEAPVVVDLDAAWKRKTSLKSPSHSSEQSIKLSAEILSLKKDESSVNNSENSGVNLVKENTPDHFQTSDINMMQNRSIEQHDSNERKADNQIIKEHEVEFISEEHKPSTLDEVGSICEDISKRSDPEDAPNSALHLKPIPDDSLSELSEIHLSCGSEPEQQKEDSDNW
ncbi:UNVERIFIED_CONTAM: Ofd1 [Trichonephila clavipes]